MQAAECAEGTLLAAAILLASVASGCGAQGSGAAGVVVRDSAGVEIVESAGRPAETWRLAETPEVELGAGEGDDLHQVRGAARLADGRIAVADGGSGTIRLYARNGRLVASAGGPGGGPGEFALLGGFAVGDGDTLLAFDVLGSRLSVFSPDGRFERSVRLQPVAGYTPQVIPIGSLDGATFAARARKSGEGAVPSGTVTERVEVAVVLFGLDGEARTVLGPFPGPEQVVQVGDAGGGSFSIRSVPVPFQKDLQTAAAAGWLAVAGTDHYVFRLYGADGELRRIVREAREPRKVTSADVDAWISQRVRAAPGSPAFRERRREYDRLRIPETLPAFETLRLDDVGRLWVREYEPAPTDEARWRVYDPRARRFAEIAMPTAFLPRQIGEDFVLGVWTDEMGVERIRLYRILTGRTGSA